VDVGVDETGPNNLATCVARFHIFEELLAGQWQDCSGEAMDITGYFYLEKKDGSLNTIAIDSLKAALGWDGRDPFWLQDADFSEVAVQLKLGFEEYQGQQRIKVQFLNPYGSSGGGVTKADEPKKATIRNRLGSKFRSIAGPAPASPAKNAAPSTPSRRSPEKKAAPEPEPAGATVDEAWAEFCRHCKGEWTQEQVEQEWFRIIAELFGGKQPDELSPTEWATMRTEGPGKILPF